MLTLRQVWASMFLQAEQQASITPVILDTYFFKIFGHYLTKPGMEWLVKPHDPYLPLLQHLNQLDQEHFPDAECVILFEMSQADWIACLKARGRTVDQLDSFIGSYERTSRYIKEATQEYCRRKNSTLLNFQHEFGNQMQQAKRLREALHTHAII